MVSRIDTPGPDDTTRHALIVVAEDSAEFRALVATSLEKTGYRVEQVSTGDRLLFTVHRLVRDGDPPKLIVTDVRMPTLGGLDAAVTLRAAGHRTPFIFMTAWGDHLTRARARELDAVLLDKPLRISELRAEVQKLLGEGSVP
ncbi:MAG TPA: response regulator [Kofleriaceae bacterium]|nr:response regulator [Kofleriaceae bacterium]